MNSESNFFYRYETSLRKSSFFSNCNSEAMHKLLQFMTSENWKVRSFKSSTEVSSTFHFIVSGRLKVYKSNPDSGREHTVFVLSEGDVLSLLDSKEDNTLTRSANII